MATWYRALDNRGRLFAIAVTEQKAHVYYPESDDKNFVVGPPDRSDGNVTTISFGGLPVKLWREDLEVAKLADFKRSLFIVGQCEEPASAPGMYFPRVYRGPEHPPIDRGARTATMRAARSLFARLREIFQVVEPTADHHKVYGHDLRQLLILACTEVESSWRAILTANGYPGERWTTMDYVKLLEPMKLDSYALTLATHPEYGVLTPFEGWDVNDPTRSLRWYDAYNATKHNREAELNRATLRAVIHALAAVHVMTVAQFGFDEVERSDFHPDEFNFERSWRWFGDSYVRPLLPPETPTVDENNNYAEWPTEWVQGPCPFV
jgi:hypothetical protein